MEEEEMLIKDSRQQFDISSNARLSLILANAIFERKKRKISLKSNLPNNSSSRNH